MKFHELEARPYLLSVGEALIEGRPSGRAALRGLVKSIRFRLHGRATRTSLAGRRSFLARNPRRPRFSSPLRPEKTPPNTSDRETGVSTLATTVAPSALCQPLAQPLRLYVTAAEPLSSGHHRQSFVSLPCIPFSFLGHGQRSCTSGSRAHRNSRLIRVATSQRR